MLSAFETDRLLLRPFKDDDLPELARLYSSSAVMRFVAPVRDLEQTRVRLRKHQRDLKTYGFGLFAAVEKSTSSLIGRCGLDPEEIDNELQGELAWMFFPEFWGKGLATEFGARMLEVGFGQLSLRRIFAHAHPENEASIKVMQKIGMQYVGRSNDEVEYETFGV